MQKLLFVLVLWTCLAAEASALSKQDIVKLSRAGISAEVIISQIKVSGVKFTLSTDEIIQLKKAGVSDQVLQAMIQSALPAQQPRAGRPSAEKLRQERVVPEYDYAMSRMRPFDQFFLSTYYSHEYGWPVPNYGSPYDILAAGLYYPPPYRYPFATRMRIYGYSWCDRPFYYHFSPFTMIVPRYPYR